MKSTTARTARSTRPTLVVTPTTELRATKQDPKVVGLNPEYEVRASHSVQLASFENDSGKEEHRWMTWIATVYYRKDGSDEGSDEESGEGTSVRLVAEQIDSESKPSTTATADITRAIGILSVEEFRAVVAGLNKLASLLPTEAPFASAAARERGE